MKLRLAAALLACAALVATQAVAPFCTATAPAAMPCCKTDAPCATAGIKAPGCCNIEPTPERPRAPSAVPGDGGEAFRTLAALPAATPAAVAAIGPAAWTRAPADEARGAPVPLFLLHASLLC
jgi:hypothetical protein